MHKNGVLKLAIKEPFLFIFNKIAQKVLGILKIFVN